MVRMATERGMDRRRAAEAEEEAREYARWGAREAIRIIF